MLEGAELGHPPYAHRLWSYRGSFTWLPGVALDEAAFDEFASTSLNALPK